MSRADNQRRYLQRLSEKLRAERGNKCQGDSCHETAALEWAHTKPTGLNGRGRGKAARLLDVQKNPDCYLLLCPNCHSDLDDGKYNRPYAPPDAAQEPIPF